MATTVIQGLPLRTRSLRSMPQLVLGWVLIIPLVFYAVHGTPSFESLRTSADNESSLSGLASNGRHPGIVESIIIPGVAFSIVMWLLLTNLKPVLSMALQMWVQTLLSMLTVFSVAWSQDPFRSAYNGCFCLIETLFAYYLVTKFDVEELRTVVMMAGLAISMVGLGMVFLTPQFAVTHSARDGLAWTGLFTDRTTTGKAMVFLLSPAIIFVRRTFRYWHIFYILLLSFLTFMAHAATARVILLLYIAVMASIHFYKTFGRRSSVVIAGIIAAAGAVVISIGFALSPLVLKTLGRNATLSGRTVIWGFVARSIAKRPLLGYGFYSFWLGMKGESARLIVGTHWTFGYAHNGVLEIWLQLGLVGVVLFFITLFQATKNAWFCLRRGSRPGVQWYVGLIVLTMLYNVDESTVFWPIDLLTIFYLVACAGLATAVRQIRQIETIEAMHR